MHSELPIFKHQLHQPCHSSFLHSRRSANTAEQWGRQYSDFADRACRKRKLNSVDYNNSNTSYKSRTSLLGPQMLADASY
jgi:hypothetical protein